MDPFTLCRNDILMAHQDNRPVVISPFPFEKKISVYFCFLQFLMYKREQFLQQPVETEKFFPVVYSLMRSGIIRHHAGELSGILFRALFIRMRLVIRDLFRNTECMNQCGDQKCRQR